MDLTDGLTELELYGLDRGTGELDLTDGLTELELYGLDRWTDRTGVVWT
jgi:hypothetical protein